MGTPPARLATSAEVDGMAEALSPAFHPTIWPMWRDPQPPVQDA